MGNLMMSDDLSKHQDIANRAEELDDADNMPVIVEGTVGEYAKYWAWLIRKSSVGLEDIGKTLLNANQSGVGGLAELTRELFELNRTEGDAP